MIVVNDVDLILAPGEVGFDDEYESVELFQGNVQTFTVANREACVAELARLTKGVRKVTGEPSVGKSTYLPKRLSELTGKYVVVISPNSALAANGALSLNTVYKTNEASCVVSIGSHYGDGNVVYMAADYLSLQLMDGYLFTDMVSHIILDECHVADGYMSAVKGLLTKVAVKFPVLFVSGTHAGTLNAKTYDGVSQFGYEDYDARKHRDVATAVYCESNKAAKEMADNHQGHYLSEYSSYAVLSKVYQEMKSNQISVFLGPNLSEGLNLPVKRVIDCRKRVVFYYDFRREAGFYKRESVPNDAHAQRVKRLRDGGEYCGHDLKALCDVTTVSVNPVEQAFGKWIINEVTATGVTDGFLSALSGRLSKDELQQAYIEGKPWYEVLVLPEVDSTDYGSARSLSPDCQVALVKHQPMVDSYIASLNRPPLIDEETGCKSPVGIALTGHTYSHDYLKSILDHKYSKSSFYQWNKEGLWSLAVSIVRDRNEIISDIVEKLATNKRLKSSRVKRLMCMMRIWEEILVDEIDFKTTPLMYKVSEKLFAVGDVLYPTHAIAKRWYQGLSLDGNEIDWHAFLN